jgi:prepilin-type N-terminal cleavage/methylation domain-containing protein
MKKTTSGFTIVELIVVIVVIGILATITVVAYGDFQARSKAAAIESSLKDIEKNLRVYASDQQWGSWPLDNAIDLGKTEPSIQTLITDLPVLKRYLPTAPIASGLAASAWIYENDGDTKPDCNSTSADGYKGTNIIVTGVAQNVANYLDAAVDDGNNSCGRIRYDASALKLLYALSYTSDLSL